MTATIELALSLLEDCGPEFGAGLSNHGPMGAEALIALGREGEVEAWTANYRKRLLDQPSNVVCIEPGEWQAALGDVARVRDWEDFFAIEMDEASWADVLERWTPRLAPGMMAGATHGIIRTAHAVRSLVAEETPLRHKELISGLAYWAARYQELPGVPRMVPPVSPTGALSRVPIFPQEQRNTRTPSIFLSVKELDGFPPFEEVVNSAAPGSDIPAFLSDLTAGMAQRYLENSGRASIAYVHTVTAPSALRMMAPVLSSETARLAARYAWQACAAIHSRFYEPHEFELPVVPPAREDVIDCAVHSGDEHAIKFAEACLRENALTPNPVYLAATWDLSGRFGKRP